MPRLSEVSPTRWLAYVLVCAGLAAVGWYLWTGHRQHLAGFLFYGLAVACTFMHFMHRGYGNGDHDHGAHGRGAEPPGRRR